MKKSLPTVLFFFLIGLMCQTTFAQDNYVKGKIYFLSGDSLAGFINYLNWRRNPEKIIFKENAEQKPTSFVPDDIKGFQVENERYFSATVQIETSQSHLSRLTEDSVFYFEDRTVFLQVLMEGIKSLYYLNDENDKEHFYILRNGNIELLQYKRYIRYVKEKDPIEDFWIKNTLVMETQKHIFQLINYMEYCADLDRQLKKLTYTRKSMESLYRFYFSCRGYNSEYEADVEKVITKPGVVAGVSSTGFSFTSSFFTSLASIQFPRSNNISAGASVEFVLPRSRRHWSFYNELMFATYSIEGGYEDVTSEENYSIVTATFGQSFIKINNMLRYTHPIGPVSLYLQAGLSNGFLVQEKNVKKTETWFFSAFSEKEEPLISETQPHETETLIGAGLRFKNISVGMRYEQGNGPSNNLALKGNVERYYVLVGYRF